MLNELYQEVILHHNKSPRNFGAIEQPDAHAVGHNPLCGDRLILTFRLDGERVEDVRFQGDGCAISKASASVMTESVKGRTIDEAMALFEVFHALVTDAEPPAGAPELGKLEVFAGVKEFPARVKCASLCWHTLQAALRGGEAPVSTE